MDYQGSSMYRIMINYIFSFLIYAFYLFFLFFLYSISTMLTRNEEVGYPLVLDLGWKAFILSPLRILAAGLFFFFPHAPFIRLRKFPSIYNLLRATVFKAQMSVIFLQIFLGGMGSFKMLTCFSFLSLKIW